MDDEFLGASLFPIKDAKELFDTYAVPFDDRENLFVAAIKACNGDKSKFRQQLDLIIYNHLRGNSRSDSAELTDEEWSELSNISAADFIKVAEQIAEEE